MLLKMHPALPDTSLLSIQQARMSCTQTVLALHSCLHDSVTQSRFTFLRCTCWVFCYDGSFRSDTGHLLLWYLSQGEILVLLKSVAPNFIPGLCSIFQRRWRYMFALRDAKMKSSVLPRRKCTQRTDSHCIIGSIPTHVFKGIG